MPPGRSAYHGLQAGDLVFCLVQELLPVPLLLEQQLGPPAEGTDSDPPGGHSGPDGPTGPTPGERGPNRLPGPLAQAHSLLLAVPQELPGDLALTLQLLRDPLLVLLQLVTLLLQLLPRGDLT